MKIIPEILKTIEKREIQKIMNTRLNIEIRIKINRAMSEGRVEKEASSR